jgi:hypothetical protein
MKQNRRMFAVAAIAAAAVALGATAVAAQTKDEPRVEQRSAMADAGRDEAQRDIHAGAEEDAHVHGQGTADPEAAHSTYGPLDALVQDGVLTKEQADAVHAALRALHDAAHEHDVAGKESDTTHEERREAHESELAAALKGLVDKDVISSDQAEKIIAAMHAGPHHAMHGPGPHGEAGEPMPHHGTHGGHGGPHGAVEQGADPQGADEGSAGAQDAPVRD